VNALLPIAAAAATLTAVTAPAALPVHVGGRILDEKDGALAFGWPGTYFESRFQGTAVRVRFEAPREHMRLLIDGDEKALFEEAAAVDLTIGALPPGTHAVRLEKLTESQTGGGRFLGFSSPGGTPLPAQPSSRRVEFIGDSYTVGYGNRSTQRECTREEVHDLTDTQQAFGPLLAKRLGADYRVVAYSGFGIVRNYGGSSPGLSLPIIYPRAKPDLSAAPTADGWQPQLIVVNLGTNDFSTALKPGERWRDEAALRADYRKRYVEFVMKIHRSSPGAKFLLMGSDEFIDDVRQVAGLLRQSPGVHVKAVRFGELDLQGCDWHPSLADHRRLAQLLEPEVAALRPW